MFGKHDGASWLWSTWTVTWFPREAGAGQTGGPVKSYLQGGAAFGLRLGVAGRSPRWPQPSGTRHCVDSADALWEGNAGRSGSVGGEHEDGLAWAEAANRVGWLLGFLRPEPHRGRRVSVFPHNLLPSRRACCCADQPPGPAGPRKQDSADQGLRLRTPDTAPSPSPPPPGLTSPPA